MSICKLRNSFELGIVAILAYSHLSMSPYISQLSQISPGTVKFLSYLTKLTRCVKLCVEIGIVGQSRERMICVGWDEVGWDVGNRIMAFLIIGRGLDLWLELDLRKVSIFPG